MKKATQSMLKELTEAHGVPGFEEEVASVIKKHLPPGTEVECDRLGSIVCKKVGSEARPRIMLPGHMDEIGFMVKLITDEGFIKFAPLGEWPDQVALSQRVFVRGSKGDVPGLIGSEPPHLVKPDERGKMVKTEDMFIDVGGKDRREVEDGLGIQIGDPIAPDSPFTTMEDKKLLVAKAWDDRVGCGLFIEVLRTLKGQSHPNSVYGVGTVQEETSTCGAHTTAKTVDPDICIVMECGLAADVPGIEAEDAQGKLGSGPILYLMDEGMIGHRRLHRFMVEVAERNEIPYQLSLLEGAATDGEPIHIHGIGVPTVFIGVPVRYVHCSAGIMHADDFDSSVSLLVETIKKLDAAAVTSIVGM